jgi:hypothetical protein
MYLLRILPELLPETEIAELKINLNQTNYNWLKQIYEDAHTTIANEYIKQFKTEYIKVSAQLQEQFT